MSCEPFLQLILSAFFLPRTIFPLIQECCKDRLSTCLKLACLESLKKLSFFFLQAPWLGPPSPASWAASSGTSGLGTGSGTRTGAGPHPSPWNSWPSCARFDSRESSATTRTTSTQSRDGTVFSRYK